MSQIPVEAEAASPSAVAVDCRDQRQRRLTLHLSWANALALAAGNGAWVLIYATATASGRADWIGLISAVEGGAYLITMTVPFWNIVPWDRTAATWGGAVAISRLCIPLAVLAGPVGWFSAAMMNGATRPMVRAITIAGQAKGTDRIEDRTSGRGLSAGNRLGKNLAGDYVIAMLVSSIGAYIVWSGIPLYFYALGLTVPTIAAAVVLGRHPWLRSIWPSRAEETTKPGTKLESPPRTRTPREYAATLAKHLFVPYGRIALICGMVPVAAAIAANGDPVLATFAGTLCAGGTALGIMASAYVMTARWRAVRIWRWHVYRYVAKSSHHPVTVLAIISLGVVGILHAKGTELQVVLVAMVLGAAVGAASHVALFREFRWAPPRTPTIVTAHRSMLGYGTNLVLGAPLLIWASSVGGWSGFAISSILYMLVWPRGWHGKGR